RLGRYRCAKPSGPRDGREEVGAARSTGEAGEPVPPGPRGGKGKPAVTAPLEGKMTGKSGSEAVSTKLQWVAELARNAPTMVLTTLAHRIDYEWMLEAYKRTRKSGAVGVDGQTAAEYAADLENNLRRLLERFKSGSYRAPPVRRVHNPKGDGKSTRPIGIPTFEDKVLQRAVVMLLEA